MNKNARYTEREKKVIDGTIAPDKVTEKTALRILEKAIYRGDDPVVELAHGIIDKFGYNCIVGFTKMQSQIIRGEIPAEEVDGRLAKRIRKKAERLGDADTLEKIEKVIRVADALTKERSRERSRTRKQKLRNGEEIAWKAPKDGEYTEYQKNVIFGDAPLEEAHTNVLIQIQQKAVINGDDDLAEKTMDIIMKRRQEELGTSHLPKVYPDSVPGYTLQQSLVIRGKTDIDNVSGKLAHNLLERAKKFGDTPVIALAEKLVAVTEAKAKEHAHELTRIRKQKLRKGERVEWKQPKSSEYKEHHIKVIRGEIPLEDVATQELIQIHLRARENGDIELSERIYNLIMDRRKAQLDRDSHRGGNRKPNNTMLSDDGFVWFGNYKDRMYFFKRDLDLLSGKEDFIDYPVDYLRHLLEICEFKQDKEKAEIATIILQYKEHPESVYVTQDHRQAVDMIEQMIGRPIRRPETWFVEKRRSYHNG